MDGRTGTKAVERRQVRRPRREVEAVEVGRFLFGVKGRKGAEVGDEVVELFAARRRCDGEDALRSLGVAAERSVGREESFVGMALKRPRERDERIHGGREGRAQRWLLS